MSNWLRWCLIGFGLFAAFALAGIIGGYSAKHISPTTAISYSDFIVIILTALAVIIAALTLLIGILAYLGWNAISRGALQKAEQIIRQELVVGGKLREVVARELRDIRYSGVESFDEDEDEDVDDDSEPS